MGILFTVIVATVIDNVPVMAHITMFVVLVELAVMLHVAAMMIAMVVLHHDVHVTQFYLYNSGVCLCCHGSQPQHSYGCQLDDVLFHIACMIWLRLMLSANG